MSLNKSQEGIWYWVWYGQEEGWKLEVFRSDERPDLGHVEIWATVVAPGLAKAFRLGNAETEGLKELPYSMPRGRMARAPEDFPDNGKIKRGHWLFHHGNDLPSDIDPDTAQGQILAAFKLNMAAARGLTHWLEDDHERMLPSEQAALARILGQKIPY